MQSAGAVSVDELTVCLSHTTPYTCVSVTHDSLHVCVCVCVCVWEMNAREMRACLIVLLIAIFVTVHVQLLAVVYMSSTDVPGKSL